MGRGRSHLLPTRARLAPASPKHRGNANGARTPASDHNQPLTKTARQGAVSRAASEATASSPRPTPSNHGPPRHDHRVTDGADLGAALRTIEREGRCRAGRASTRRHGGDHIFTHYEKRGHFNALLQRDSDPKENKNSEITATPPSAKQARCKRRRSFCRLPPPDGRFKARARFRSTKKWKTEAARHEHEWNVITHVKGGCGRLLLKRIV